MPIKFRCQHCRQFLGISREKAGNVVDCPTCGRSIRVPHLDGRVDPLPQPGLDLRDSSLQEALDALAAIGGDTREQTDDEKQFPRMQADAAPVQQPESSNPPPQPVAVAAPLPVEEVDVPVTGGPVVLPPPAGYEAEAPPAKEALAQLAARSGSPQPAPPAGSSWWRRLFPKPVFLSLCAVGIAAFGIGFLTGRLTGPRRERNETPVAPEPDAPDAQARTSDPFSEALHGRVTYKTESGDVPDVGARVIVFPESRKGSAKVSIVGFRPGDEADDLAVARAAMRALGGNVAAVDEDGVYDLGLPTAGTYRLLILSRYQSRPSDAPVPEDLTKLLAEYFDRPTQLLGRLQFVFSEVRYNGEKPVEWGHTFAPAG